MQSNEQSNHAPVEDTSDSIQFSGNIYLFHAFDVGDDVNLDKVRAIRSINEIPLALPKYFKNYHAPLSIELPHPNESARCIGGKIHNYGAISLTYKIPFSCTLEELRTELSELSNQYQEQSVIDVKLIYKRIEKHIGKPYFFQTRSSYIVVQVNPQPEKITISQLKEQYGSVIASMLRFETEALSEFQKNEMLESATGYYRGDLLLIDADAAFFYDEEYEDIIDLVEFANIQHLEMRFFDWLLDQRLNQIYENKSAPSPRSYLPFVETWGIDPMVELGKLKVDISVITERLEGSVKLAGESYLSELYELLVDNLDLKSWRNGIDRKVSIISELQSVYQSKVDTIRQDTLTILIIVLIFIELVIGILSYLR